MIWKRMFGGVIWSRLREAAKILFDLRVFPHELLAMQA